MVNIFFTSYNPKKAARNQCDKHVVKMTTESTQLLSMTHRWIEKFYPDSSITDVFGKKITDWCYKATLGQMKHPCAIWVRTSLSNYRWLCIHALELSKEYTRRYGKVHACEKLIKKLTVYEPAIQDLGLTSPAQAMPDEYKDDCPIIAYRKFYISEKRIFAKWKLGNIPDWYQ